MYIIDFNGLVYGNMFSVAKEIGYNISEKDAKIIVLNGILKVNSELKEKYGNPVIAVDGQNVWRRKIFPYYKVKRKDNRKRMKIDYEFLKDIVNQMYQEIQDNFPYKVIKVDRAEADDVIAVLCKHFHKQEDIAVVSVDSDMQQLSRYDGVINFNPKTNEFVYDDKPEEKLKIKILRGDSGDSIPNVLSEDDAIVNPNKRQKRLSSKQIEDWLSRKDFWQNPDEDVARNLKRNKVLIDLRYVPKAIEEKVIEEYNKPIKGTKKNIANYLIKNGFGNLLEEVRGF